MKRQILAPRVQLSWYWRRSRDCCFWHCGGLEVEVNQELRCIPEWFFAILRQWRRVDNGPTIDNDRLWKLEAANGCHREEFK